MVDAAVADVATAAGTQGMVVVVGEAAKSTGRWYLWHWRRWRRRRWRGRGGGGGGRDGCGDGGGWCVQAWRMHWQHSAPFGLGERYSRSPDTRRHAWSTELPDPRDEAARLLAATTTSTLPTRAPLPFSSLPMCGTVSAVHSPGPPLRHLRLSRRREALLHPDRMKMNQEARQLLKKTFIFLRV